MLIEDFSISWIATNRAVLSWDGGSIDGWWTVFLDGGSISTVLASGTIELELPINEGESHSIAIVSHVGSAEAQGSPEARRLLRPTVRWLPVDNAVEYLVYEVSVDGEETLIRTIPENGSLAYSWQFPVNLYREGLDSERVKVKARGSWGTSEVDSYVTSFLAGHPRRAVAISAEESSSGLELSIRASA